MLEFILDILFNNPEGLTFALFGLKKKRKKAEKIIKDLESTLDGINAIDINTNAGDIPQFDSDVTRTTISPQAPEASTYKPEFPYRGRQIIIDSGRVLLNAKDDSVFIVGDKAVGISTNGTFNIDSGGKTIINSPEIDLGLEAEEQAVLGNQLVLIFNEYLLGLQNLVVPQLKSATDGDNVKISGVQQAGNAMEKLNQTLNDRLNLVLSTTVKIQK